MLPSDFLRNDHKLTVLVQATLTRGFQAMMSDLRQLPTPPQPNELTDLRRYLEWDTHHLQNWYPSSASNADQGQYLIQHLRERAHHQGNTTLRDDCDRWLVEHDLPYFKSHPAWRSPVPPALLRTFNVAKHVAGSVRIALSADGTRLLSICCPSMVDGWLIQLWDTQTGAELSHFMYGRSVSSMLFSPPMLLSPDAKTIYLESHQKVRLCDYVTGEVLRDFDGVGVHSGTLSLSADGKRAAVALNDKTLRVFDPQTGDEIAAFAQKSPAGTALSADGSRLWSGSGNKTVRLWDVNLKEELFIYDCQPARVIDVDLSADGNVALAGLSDGVLLLWNLSEGGLPRRLEGHTDQVLSVQLSTDGSLAVSGSADGTVRLWNTQTGAELRRFPTGRAESVILSSDHQRIVSVSGTVITVWDAATEPNEPESMWKSSGLLSVSLSDDGRLAVTGSNDKTMRIWDTDTAAELHRIDHSQLSGSDMQSMMLTKTPTGLTARPVSMGSLAYVSSVSLSADGRLALSATGDRVLRLWDAQTARELRQTRIDGSTAVLSADGNWSLSASFASTISLWDNTTGTESRTMTGHTSRIVGVALSADGKLALSGSATGPVSGPDSANRPKDDTLRLWDTQTGQELRRFEGHRDDLTCLALSVDGHLALSGAKDATVRLWNALTGVELHHFEGHTNEISCVALSPAGHLALSGSADRTLRMWDTQTGKLLAVLHLDAIPRAIACSATTPLLIVIGVGTLHVMSLIVPST